MPDDKPLTSGPIRIEDYAAYTEACLAGHDASYLIWSEHLAKKRQDGGLADRLKGIVTAFSLALATGRIFVIDWRTPHPLRRNLQPNEYNWMFEFHEKRLQPSAEPVLIDARHDTAPAAKIHSTPIDRIEYELFGAHRVCYFNANWVLSADWLKDVGLSSEGHAQLDVVFRYLFKPLESPPLHAQLEKWKSYRNRYKVIVGVQLRSGGQQPSWVDPELVHWPSYAKLLKFAFGNIDLVIGTVGEFAATAARSAGVELIWAEL